LAIGEFPRKEITMERVEWLKQMREMGEALYDHFSPEYWIRFGL
jgi:hypothetical protein